MWKGNRTKVRWSKEVVVKMEGLREGKGHSCEGCER